MVSGHHIRLIQVSNFLDLNIYAKTPWGPRVTRIRGGCSSEVLQLLVHPSAASIWSCEIAYFLLIELIGCHAAGVDTLVTCGSRGCLIDIGQSPPDLHFNPAIDGRKQQNYLITKFIFQEEVELELESS